jgi:predicted transcriptional regulator
MQAKELVLDVHSSKIVSQIYFKDLAGKFKLKPTEQIVLNGLANHYNPTKKTVFPTQKFLSGHLNISEKSVNRAIKRLAELGLILYETKHNNRYVFTNIFFDALEMSETYGQNVLEHTDKMSDKHINKHINNNGFSKKSSNNNTFNKPVEVQITPNAIETKKQLEQIEQDKKTAGSPLDMPPEKQIEWYNNLHPSLKNSFFAKKIEKRWNLGSQNPENIANSQNTVISNNLSTENTEKLSSQDNNFSAKPNKTDILS